MIKTNQTNPLLALCSTFTTEMPGVNISVNGLSVVQLDWFADINVYIYIYSIYISKPCCEWIFSQIGVDILDSCHLLCWIQLLLNNKKYTLILLGIQPNNSFPGTAKASRSSWWWACLHPSAKERWMEMASGLTMISMIRCQAKQVKSRCEWHQKKVAMANRTALNSLLLSPNIFYRIEPSRHLQTWCFWVNCFTLPYTTLPPGHDSFCISHLDSRPTISYERACVALCFTIWKALFHPSRSNPCPHYPRSKPFSEQ